MTSSRHRTKVSDRLTVASNLFSYLAIASLIFLAIGLNGIDNYINWASFSLTMIASGVAFGLFIYSVICLLVKDARHYKNSKGIGLLAPIGFLFAMTFFGLGSLINKSDTNHKDCKEYVIQEKGKGGFRHKAYFVFIDTGTKTERLNFGKTFFEIHKVGDTVSLCIVTGKLGFEYYQVNTNA